MTETLKKYIDINSTLKMMDGSVEILKEFNGIDFTKPLTFDHPSDADTQITFNFKIENSSDTNEVTTHSKYTNDENKYNIVTDPKDIEQLMKQCEENSDNFDTVVCPNTFELMFVRKSDGAAVQAIDIKRLKENVSL